MKNFLRKLSIFLFTIILFATTSGLLIIIPIKNTLKKNTIQEVISHLEIEKLVEENPKFQETINEVLEPIYEETDKLGIPQETVIKIIDSKEVKDLVGDVSNNVISYLLTGKEQKLITTKNIESIVADSIDDINASGIEHINEEKKEKLLNIVRTKVDEEQEFIPTTKIIEKSVKLSPSTQEKLDIIHFIVSDKLIILLSLTLIFSIIFLIFLKTKEAKWFKWCANTIMLAAILNLLTVSLIYFISKILFALDFPYILELINKILKFNFKLSIILIIVMILCLIFYKIAHKKLIKK